MGVMNTMVPVHAKVRSACAAGVYVCDFSSEDGSIHVRTRYKRQQPPLTSYARKTTNNDSRAGYSKVFTASAYRITTDTPAYCPQLSNKTQQSKKNRQKIRTQYVKAISYEPIENKKI